MSLGGGGKRVWSADRLSTFGWMAPQPCAYECMYMESVDHLKNTQKHGREPGGGYDQDTLYYCMKTVKGINRIFLIKTHTEVR